MFIWDFIADTVLGQIVDWIYGQIVGFLGDFFMQMGNMGAEMFEMTWQVHRRGHNHIRRPAFLLIYDIYCDLHPPSEGPD